LPENMKKLVILHTNDIHSHFEQMPKIATAFRELKKNRGNAQVFTIDGGDHMDRMAIETEGSLGHANIAVMNATGYDLAVPGNNEGLTFSRDEITELYGKQAKFRVLCCNLAEGASGETPSWMLPCRIEERDGMRVGFIGATAFYPDFYSLLGWEIRDPQQSIANQVALIREQTDILVVISHLGLSSDERMAREIPGIDLILGAHTHHLFETPVRIGSTYLAAGGKFGQYLGEIEISYDTDSRTITELNGCVLRVDNFKPDPAISELIHNYHEESRRKLNQKICDLPEPMEIDWRGESRMGNLLAAGLRRWVDADIGIVNAGQILNGLERGAVTREKLLHLCPSPINPCMMLLKGEHLVQALEQSLLPEFMDKPIYGFGFRGKVLGSLCVDGLEIVYDSKAPPMQKIKTIMAGGEPFDPDKEYRVGTIDMFTFHIGYMSLGQGNEIRYALPEFLRDVLEHELKEPDLIEASGSRRWTDVKP
jgi:5'-nucleotidase